MKTRTAKAKARELENERRQALSSTQADLAKAIIGGLRAAKKARAEVVVDAPENRGDLWGLPWWEKERHLQGLGSVENPQRKRVRTRAEKVLASLCVYTLK